MDASGNVHHPLIGEGTIIKGEGTMTMIKGGEGKQVRARLLYVSDIEYGKGGRIVYELC